MQFPQEHSSFDPFNMDARLVAAVQVQAGARSHEAGDLLASYELWAELHRQAVDAHHEAEARESRDVLTETEADLRRLLYQCRRAALHNDPHPVSDGPVGSEAPAFPGYEPRYGCPL
jgi:hypothetical protein